jgi:hypothetical protein
LNLGAPITSKTTQPTSDVTAVNAVEPTKDIQENGYQVDEAPAETRAAPVVAASPVVPTKETEVAPAQPAVSATTAPVAAKEKITATEKPAQAPATVPAALASTSKAAAAPKKKKGGLFAACCGKGDHIE